MKLLYALFTFLTVWALLLFSDAKEWATFEVQVDDELEASAFAADIPSAKTHLDKAVAYLEKEKYTEGSTHLLWYGASDDVGIWYKRLKGLQKMLAEYAKSEPSRLTFRTAGEPPFTVSKIGPGGERTPLQWQDVMIETCSREMAVWESQLLGNLRSMLLKPEKGDMRRPNTVWNLHHKWGGFFLTTGWILSAAMALFLGLYKAMKS